LKDRESKQRLEQLQKEKIMDEMRKVEMKHEIEEMQRIEEEKIREKEMNERRKHELEERSKR
jgi:hypothetical protein